MPRKFQPLEAIVVVPKSNLAKKGTKSKTHPGDLDFTAKKETKSKTHPGDLDFTAKKGTKSKTHPGKEDFIARLFKIIYK